MPDAKQIQFGERLRKIDKHHRKLSRGYVTSINHDGLIIARPHRQSSGLPLRGLFLCLAALMLFKGFLFAQLGPLAYADRVGLLENGTIVEQMGAYAMKADPLTVWLGTQVGGLLR